MGPALRSLVDLAAVCIAAFLFVEQLGDPAVRLQAAVSSTLTAFQEYHKDDYDIRPVEGGMELIHVCFVTNDFDAGRAAGFLGGAPLVFIALAVRHAAYTRPRRRFALLDSGY